jgi:RNase H-fold protein (predicted Holliday junction resolvase)
MKKEILSLRISRRAIGVAVMTSDGVIAADGRHLSSNAQRAVTAATRYVDRLLQSQALTGVVVEAPLEGGSRTTDGVLASVRELLSEKAISTVVLRKSDLLVAYGTSRLRSRKELRAIVSDYWPVLAGMTGRLGPYARDAAAAALFGECQLALGPSPT